MIKNAIRDGLAIRADEDATCFHTNGLDFDPWTKTLKWKELVSGLVIAEDKDNRVRVVSSGGKNCTKIGQGTFNIVLRYPSSFVARDLPGNLAWRVTRPDKDGAGEHRYQKTSTAVGELKNALFASSNRIGVAVHGVAAFEAMRPGRTMRHGMVMAMECAECDLIRFLENMHTEAEGSRAAENMVELLFRVSRIGVAFTDIKPGNVLVFKDENDSSIYRLTDYDPAFFIVTDKDWRSLLLLNLALLSAHVHNGDFGAAGRGWAKTTALVLRQLVRCKRMYDSDWLFSMRCVAIDFNEPMDASDFELQKNATAVWYSYFVKRCRRESMAFKFKWLDITENECELDKHWQNHPGRGSWPTGWDRPGRNPLIEQIVDFALEYC